jgi:hypothetical protein
MGQCAMMNHGSDFVSKYGSLMNHGCEGYIVILDENMSQCAMMSHGSDFGSNMVQ